LVHFISAPSLFDGAAAGWPAATEVKIDSPPSSVQFDFLMQSINLPNAGIGVGLARALP
jgi:hypothetical protein